MFSAAARHLEHQAAIGQEVAQRIDDRIAIAQRRGRMLAHRARVFGDDPGRRVAAHSPSAANSSRNLSASGLFSTSATCNRFGQFSPSVLPCNTSVSFLSGTFSNSPA